MNEWTEQYKEYHADQNTNYPGNNQKPLVVVDAEYFVKLHEKSS